MTSFQRSMHTSGFFTRSVASFAISRNFSPRDAPSGIAAASLRMRPINFSQSRRFS